MYLPSAFRNHETERSLALMRSAPFATVITVDSGGEPFVSHLPLVVEVDGDTVVCVGHMARANPHWRLLPHGQTTAIFHGPHAYITPTWYTQNNVPTWNYAVVHARGQAELIEDRAGIEACLRALTVHVERGPGAWAFWIPDDLADRLDQAIVGFRLRVTTN
jgi:transcriptional regulator